ncbi:MAG: hypothetical protein JSW58_09660, partial [Candidatus Latescibacterota bacterium]
MQKRPTNVETGAGTAHRVRGLWGCAGEFRSAPTPRNVVGILEAAIGARGLFEPPYRHNPRAKRSISFP